MNKEEIQKDIDELRSQIDGIKAERESAKAEEQRAMDAQKIENPARVEERTMEQNQWRSVYDAMIEKRAISIGNNGTGKVQFVNELMKAMVAKKPLLGKVKTFYGPNASTEIPVLNPTIARPAGQVEGVKGLTGDENDGAKIATKALKPHAYISILPVTAEALKFSALDIEAELPAIFAEAFADAMQKGMVTGDGLSQNMKGIFNGVAEANKIDCKAVGTPSMEDVVNLALKLADMADDAVLIMNPTVYSAITAAKGDDYQTYREILIRDKVVEGVKVLLTSYAPADVSPEHIAVVGGRLSNYALAIADELQIEPFRKLGDLNTYFQCSAWWNGDVVMPENFYGLKTIAGK